MITYEQVKDWLKEKDNKQKIVTGACFVVVFFVGFGTGHYNRNANHSKLQSNYTTFQSKKPVLVPSKEGEAADNKNNDNNKEIKIATSTPSAACIIKGNISASGKKIYHVKGGSFYARVKPEQCFTTEAQAQTAGFVKSSR